MNGPESDPAAWPEHVPAYRQGEVIERDLEIFNDGLSGSNFRLKWETRWDSETGEMVEQGVIDPIQIKPGFHRTIQLHFNAPVGAHGSRELFLVFSVELEGVEVFYEDALHFTITRS
jgi:hypothetical protein